MSSPPVNRRFALGSPSISGEVVPGVRREQLLLRNNSSDTLSASNAVDPLEGRLQRPGSLQDRIRTQAIIRLPLLRVMPPPILREPQSFTLELLAVIRRSQGDRLQSGNLTKGSDSVERVFERLFCPLPGCWIGLLVAVATMAWLALRASMVVGNNHRARGTSFRLPPQSLTPASVSKIPKSADKDIPLANFVQLGKNWGAWQVGLNLNYGNKIYGQYITLIAR